MSDKNIAQPTYWEHRYQAGTAVWDINEPAPALLAWLDLNRGRKGKVLVLGCGCGHDAVALSAHGFDVVAVDFASSAITATVALAASVGVSLAVLEADLFALPVTFDHSMDVVFEHTFFCALEPTRRPAYRDLVSRLLKPNGELVGVFFTFDDDGEPGPPFTVTPDELIVLLASKFEAVTLDQVANSVARRHGDEHFGVFRRREVPIESLG